MARTSRSLLPVAATALAAAVLLTPACHTNPTPRNLVLISLDTTRADHLSCYGMKGEVTPSIDALAAAGAILDHTITPVPMTLPAHSSLLTGMIPPATGVHDNFNYRLRDSAETLAETLQKHGFETAGFVSAFVLDRRFGLSQGFDTWDDTFDNPIRTDFGTERRGGETVDHAIRWLEGRGATPFFLFLHLYDPHQPYNPPEPYASRFPGDPYTGEIAYADHCVGRLLEALKAHDLDSNTLVVLVGDHGEELGQHGEETHSYFVYQPALHVPCIFRGPGVPAGLRIEEPTGLIDVVPTVCNLLGVPSPKNVQGEDLTRFLRGEAQPPQRTLYYESLTPTRYGANPLLGETDGRWKYIRTTRSELYDLPSDATEATNLLKGHDQIVRRLQRALNAHRKLASLAAEASRSATDREAAAKLQSLGYLSSDVEDTLSIEPGRPDPKDLITVHEANQRAIRMISEGNYFEAEKAAHQVLKKLPDFYEAWMNLGRIAVAQKDWPAAVPYLQKAVELKPDLYSALYDLGVAYTQMEKLHDATEVFRRAVEYDPQPPAAHLNLARSLVNEKRWEEAAVELETVLRLRPGDPAAANMLAEAEAQTGHLERAIPHLEEAVQRHPKDVRTRFSLAQALLATSRTDEAVAQLRTLTGPGSDPAILARVRALLEQAGRPDLASELGGAGPASGAAPAPTRGDPAALLQAGKAAEAERAARARLDADPADTTSWNLLAVALAQQGRLDEARTELRSLLAAHPDNAGGWLNLALVTLEDKGPQTGLDEAIPMLKKAARLDPGLVQARINLAQAYLRKGDNRQAIAQLEAAIGARPDEPELLDRLAFVLARVPDTKLRDPARAIQLAQRACELTQRREPRYLRTLAQAHAAAGDFLQAAAIVREALSLSRSKGDQALTRQLNADLARYENAS